ncbi:LapA family protein [Promicromonospora sp. MEB111]|uniref:LapA family protein n=1 Tax=unclassified Promicromonospora TaxID=2647929 RepID=UPI00254A865A|nr:LapA family protein [Promicromonospora sp. MEB111]
MATVPTPTPPLPSATNGNPNRSGHDTLGSSHIRRTSTHSVKASRSRAGWLWAGSCLAALVLVALIIFMLQNTQLVLVSFLGMQGTVPLAVALLITGVGVGIIALVIGTIRSARLRRRIQRGN